MSTRFRRPSYWLRLLILAAVAIGVIVVALPMGAGAATMWALTHPACAGDERTPGDLGIPNAIRINIPSRSGGAYRGYFMPGTNDATIIIPPTYSGSRISMIDEGSILVKAGHYNLLMFESRVCAGKGAISLGYSEVDDVGDALDYLRNNYDSIGVNMAHIALHGFSSAGATAIMAAARYPEIAAVYSRVPP